MIHEYIREHALSWCGALVSVPDRPVPSPDELRRILRNEAWVEGYLLGGAESYTNVLQTERDLLWDAFVLETERDLLWDAFVLDYSLELCDIQTLALNRMVQGVFRYSSSCLSDAWPRERLLAEGALRLARAYHCRAIEAYDLIADVFNFARMSWERYHRGLP